MFFHFDSHSRLSPVIFLVVWVGFSIYSGVDWMSRCSNLATCKPSFSKTPESDSFWFRVYLPSVVPKPTIPNVRQVTSSSWLGRRDYLSLFLSSFVIMYRCVCLYVSINVHRFSGFALFVSARTDFRSLSTHPLLISSHRVLIGFRILSVRFPTFPPPFVSPSRAFDSTFPPGY